VPLVIIWLVLMIGAFYLLLWRPQQRRMAMVRALQSTLRQGDEVLTTSGIYARVVRLGDDDAELEIAPGTVIRVARGAIGQVLTDHDETLNTSENTFGNPTGDTTGDASGEASEAG
jgi:preprotein translocase subunit YajC